MNTESVQAHADYAGHNEGGIIALAARFFPFAAIALFSQRLRRHCAPPNHV
jgi:hypothetical protein